MPVSSDYLAYVVEQLAQTGKVSTRRMFGGIGVYCEGVFFGLIDDDVFYLKVDAANRQDYLERHCQAFKPMARDPNAYSMNYFAVPQEVLEDADELRSWARKSIAIAAAAKLRALNPIPKRGKRAKKVAAKKRRKI